MEARALVTFYALLSTVHGTEYIIDDSLGLGRIFDGIGGLSGGGATSKLLINYHEPQRSQILDYLFKPNFGASLQILKVEIGGDAQSTDGTEATHMRTPWDENYHRGYEWWLMAEAKKRNPEIKIYGLPWSFPGWVGKGSNNPYKHPNITSNYIIKWIHGAKTYYNVTIDFIGIWNEKQYNVNYILILRDQLDRNGLTNVQIIAPDAPLMSGHEWNISYDILKNAKLKNALYAIGVHYPGTVSIPAAVKTGLKLWASEEYSTFNDNIGAGCWARILNQNYVNGNLTASISWNLIAAYYNNLPYPRCALMTANEPWSGHYVVEGPIWMTSHTTQFTKIGWAYFKHGNGSGKLKDGGSYVSLLSPDKKDVTVIIETMTHDHSVCIRPHVPEYVVKNQTATFSIKGSLSNVSVLHVWYSKLSFDGSQSVLMTKLEDIHVSGGSFQLRLEPDTVHTVTTITTASKGMYYPPPSEELELPYTDNFDNNSEYSEAFNWAPQIGSFEIRNSSDTARGMINRQAVTQTPIYWCKGATDKPVTMGGNYNWTDVNVTIDVYIPSVNGTDGAFIAARVTEGGCKTNGAKGVFLWMYPGTQTYELTSDFAQKKILTKGKISISKDKWFTITFMTEGNKVILNIDGKKSIVTLEAGNASPSGFIAYGTHNFGIADFDKFKVEPNFEYNQKTYYKNPRKPPIHNDHQ